MIRRIATHQAINANHVMAAYRTVTSQTQETPQRKWQRVSA